MQQSPTPHAAQQTADRLHAQTTQSTDASANLSHLHQEPQHEHHA